MHDQDQETAVLKEVRGATLRSRPAATALFKSARLVGFDMDIGGRPRRYSLVHLSEHFFGRLTE